MSKISPFVFAVALFAIICVQSIDGLTVPTLHKQCVDMGFDGVCRSGLSKLTTSKHVGRCAFKLVCAVKKGNTYYKQNAGYPQDGTPCGPGKICRGKRCVDTALKITLEGGLMIQNCDTLVPHVFQITPKATPKPNI